MMTDIIIIVLFLFMLLLCLHNHHHHHHHHHFTGNCDKIILSLCFNGYFPGEAGLAGFIEAKDDGGGGDNWSYKTCKAPIKSSPPTNQHAVFFRPDVLPVAQPTVSKHWRERIKWFSSLTITQCPSVPWHCQVGDSMGTQHVKDSAPTAFVSDLLSGSVLTTTVHPKQLSHNLILHDLLVSLRAR